MLAVSGLVATLFGVLIHFVTDREDRASFATAHPWLNGPSVCVMFGLLVLLAIAVQVRIIRLGVVTRSSDQTALAAAEIVRAGSGRILRGIANNAWLLDVPLRVLTSTWLEDRRRLDTDALAAAFRAAPRRRLVILGGPGAGKTIAVQRMAFRLLEAAADEPVPVVVSLASWSGELSLEEWLTNVLANEYPRLPRATLFDLIVAGQVLPMFDGLDEISPSRWALFLDILDRSCPSFVLTCRTKEYKAAAADALTRAFPAVVELEPITLQDARYYLLFPQRPDDSRWTPLLDFLVDRPESPLAAALTTPLSLELVLRAYAAPQTSPTELLNTTRFATAGAIERYLMETALVRAASGGGASDPEPGERAVPWLGFLAAHLVRLGTVNLAWWRLSREVSQAVFLVVAALVGTVAGFFGGLAFTSSWVGVAIGVVAAGVTAVGLGRSVTAAPFPAHVRLSGRPSVVACALGTGVGVAAGVVVWASGGGLGSAVGWAAVGVAVGALIALRVAITGWFDWHAVWPTVSLRGDRHMAYVQGAVTAWTVVLAAALAGAFERGFVSVLAFGIAAGLVGMSFSAYARYLVSLVWLALRDVLPLRLMTFLDAERRLGLLRESGGVYQFYRRHLQDYLAAEFDTNRPHVDEDATRMVLLLREELVERAFARADVRAVIEAPNIARLKKEIIAEIEDTVGDLVTATESARERFVTVKEWLLARAGVSRLARGAQYFGYPGSLLAVVAAGVLFAMTFPVASLVVTQAIALLTVSLAYILHPAWWEIDFTGFPADEEDERSQLVKRLEQWHRAAAKFLAPLHRRLPEGLFWNAMFTAGALSVVTHAAPAWERAWPLPVIVMGVAAVLLLGVWRWTKPLNARWNALSVDDPRHWPGEHELPRRIAQARRDAVSAWEALVEALVENRVLPMVAARVEVLAKRSYDTKLPESSVKWLGDLTESAQFVPTQTSARLNRMLDAMTGGSIGLSGPRGIGKSTVLGIFGHHRFGGNPDDLTVVVSAPTNYQNRDFLVHLFRRVCSAVLPADTQTAQATLRRPRLPWVLAAVGALVILGAALWPSAVEAGRWAWRNMRIVALSLGVALVPAPAVAAAVRWSFRRRRDEVSVADVAQHYLRTLRYLETTTQTATATVKPSIVELGGSRARQRAEQVTTYPELVGEFRDFLTFLASRLPTRPDRREPRLVVCIDEVDKIATAEAAEQFINDLKTVFGVSGCFFLVAVSEDALAAFSRQALTVRTAFDSAFDTVIQVSRLTLTQTRRLLVQRVLRLPEPYVWLCHALSGGLPRDLNRIVRQLYDIRADKGTDALDALTAELVRQDLEVVTYGQILHVDGGSDPVAGALRQWFAHTAHVPLNHNSLIAHRDSAPPADITLDGWPPKLWVVRERFQAYLYYAAEVLRSFQEESTDVINRLSNIDDDVNNPMQYLADARTQLSVDATLATAAVHAYRTALGL
jgi:hypothetical protein